MTGAPLHMQPRALPDQDGAGGVEPRVSAQAAIDVRVSMVLAVLGGRTIESVAADWDVETSMLHRWVRDFLVAGTAAVTNRPDPDEARQRDRFLAAFAHELRTPVSVAGGWAMMLADGDLPESQIAGTLRRLSDALERLSEHIQDVETAATVSLGRLPVHHESVPAAALCAALAGIPEVARGGELNLWGDPELLGRALRDLWRTARRDPEPDAVEVEVAATGSWHEIRVVRHGAPISPMVLQALFDPFGTNDDATGVTIGLYLARALAVAHGGFLGAEGDGERTVLYLRIPQEPTSGTAAAPVAGRNHPREETR